LLGNSQSGSHLPDYTSNALPLFLEGLEQVRESQILDVGSICGDNIRFFARRVKRLYICDMFFHLSRDPRGILPQNQIWKHLDYPPHSFDGILLWNLVDYLNDSEGMVLASLAGKSMSGTVPCSFVVKDRFRLEINPKPEIDLSLHIRSNREVLELTEQLRSSFCHPVKVAMMKEKTEADRVKAISLFIWAIGTLFYSYEMLIKSSVASMSFIFMQDYHLDASDLSLVGSMFYCVYVIMQIPAGILADRFGVKKCLSVATLFAAGGTLMYSRSSEFHMFLVARCVMGIGGSFGFVCALKLASEWFPSRYFPLFAGLTQLLGYLGGAFSGNPLAVIVHAHNWPSVFMVIALIGFGLTVLTVLFVKNRPDRAGLDPAQRASIKGTLYQLWELLKQPQILVNGLYCACTVGVTFALTDLWGKPALMTIDQISEGTASAVCIGCGNKQETPDLRGSDGECLNPHDALCPHACGRTLHHRGPDRSRAIGSRAQL